MKTSTAKYGFFGSDGLAIGGASMRTTGTWYYLVKTSLRSTKTIWEWWSGEFQGLFFG